MFQYTKNVLVQLLTVERSTVSNDINNTNVKNEVNLVHGSFGRIEKLAELQLALAILRLQQQQQSQTQHYCTLGTRGRMAI